MTRNILLVLLLTVFSFSQVAIAAPAENKTKPVVVTAKKVKKAEPKKEEPVAYKKPTRKKVVKK